MYDVIATSTTRRRRSTTIKRANRKMNGSMRGHNNPPEDDIYDLMREYAEASREIEAQKIVLEEAAKQIEQYLTDNGLEKFVAPEGVATMEHKTGNRKTEVDRDKLEELLDENELRECTSINITQLKKLLTEKELKSISRTIPGQKKPPELKITVA